MPENSELRNRLEARRQLANDIAIINSVPPITAENAASAEEVIANIGASLSALENRPIQRNALIKFSKDLLKEKSETDSLRFLIWPWPSLPWPIEIPKPPIPPVVDREELELLADDITRRINPDTIADEDIPVLRIFPAIIAGLALGTVCGKLYNKLTRSTESATEYEGERIKFATEYVQMHGLSTLQSAVYTRPDYEAAMVSLGPALDQQMAASDTQALFEKLQNDVQEEVDRILPAVVFGISFALAFTAEVL